MALQTSRSVRSQLATAFACCPEIVEIAPARGAPVGHRPWCAGSAGLDVKMAGMDLARARFLVDVLTPSGHLERIREFAGSLRQSTQRDGELLVVGTPGFEPWHFTAHMADEARWARLPELEPTLVRWSVPRSAPSHLAVPLERLEAARRGETLMVVTTERAPHPLLERVADARKIGATILTMDSGDPDLAGLAHDALVLPRGLTQRTPPATSNWTTSHRRARAWRALL
jgi:hypothetical protein